MRTHRIWIAALVVAVVVYTVGRLDWAAVLAALAGVRPLPMLAAALLVVLPLGARSVRARTLLAEVGYAEIPASRIAAVTVFGFSMSSLTPGGSGDLLRIAALRPYGVAPSVSAAVVVYERILDVAVMASLLGVALAVTLLPPAVASAVIGAGVLVLVLGAAGYARWQPDPDVWMSRLPARVHGLLPPVEIARTLFRPKVLGRAVATTILVFVTEALRPWLVLVALGLSTGFFAAWAIFTLAWLAGLVSMLPLGVGSWEAAAIWAFQLYGVDANTGAAGAVLLRAGVTLPAIVLGVVSMFSLRRVAGEASEEGADD